MNYHSKDEEQEHHIIQQSALYHLVYDKDDMFKHKLNKLMFKREYADVFVAICNTPDYNIASIVFYCERTYQYKPDFVLSVINRCSTVYSKEVILKILREYMFREISENRANTISNIHESQPITQSRRYVVQEAEKIISLDKALFKPSMVEHTKELIKNTVNAINTEDDTIYTHWSPIDSRTGGLTKRGISSILALPSNMKSTFTDFLVSNIVENSKARGVIISLEDPIERRLTRIVASRLQLSLTDIRFKKIKVTESQIAYIVQEVLGGRLYIFDPRTCSTPQDAVNIINELAPDIVVVDHVQKFVMTDMVQGIIQAVIAIENASIKNNTHCIITSQVTEKAMKFRGGDNKAPTSADANWTSILHQSSNEMFSLYYPFKYTNNPFEKDILELHILKSKYASTLDNKIKFNILADQAKILDEFSI